MSLSAARKRSFVASLVIANAVIAAVLFGAVTRAEYEPAAIFGDPIGATKSDALIFGDGDGKADPGESGKPFINVQAARKMDVTFQGDADAVDALLSGRAMARTLASADFDGDAAPDVVAGYGLDGTGLITIQRGNPDAFAPKDESVYARMQQGYNPDALLPVADTYLVPESPDFLQVGDFNHDSRKDVLVAAQGGSLFLLAGDGSGGIGLPERINLPGTVTSMTAGEFRAPDGWTDAAVAIDGPSGPKVMIFDGVDGFAGTPMSLSLPAPVSAMEFGEMDASPFMGLAIAAGSQINVLHGWGRKQSPRLESRVERIDTGMNVRGLASGFFVWSREGSNQFAALGDDGTIRIFGRGVLNTQPLTDQELTARARLRLQPKDTAKIDVETLSGWQVAKGEFWTKARELGTGNFVGADATSQDLLRSADISFADTDDLVVLGGGRKLDILGQVDSTKSVRANANLIGGDFITTRMESSDAVATVALPQKLNGWRDLLVMEAGNVAVIPLAPTATITVDRTDDPAITGSGVGAAACTGAGSDCSLRGAVEFANANSGTVISLGATTYILNTPGTNGCLNENATTGNRIGDLEINASTTVMGVTAASTIIRQAAATNDRVFCLDVPLASGRTYTFEALTITGGRDTASGVGGGGIIGGAAGTTLNLKNVTFANNQTTGPGSSGGGGVAVTGGDMNVENCTFGAATNPVAASPRNDLTLGNMANSNSGGGLDYSPGDPTGANGATGTLTITGTTFTHNTSTGNGGGGLTVREFNVSVGTADISTSSFVSNQANTNGMSAGVGGGLFNQSLHNVNVSTTSFTNNSSVNRGGGIYVGGGIETLLNGTTPGITFSGNTAPDGSSISAAGAVRVTGTNTTVGGDLEITTNGAWTNDTGSAISPQNFIMTGTANFTGNNSTTNVSGNFNFGSGTFNGGTGTFNFNGTVAQSITNAGTITFFNLTDSNVTQPLTLNDSFAVSNTLNVNGANAILSPVAAAVISGGGTLVGTGTARASRISATADFLNQYTITTKTLTNLTIDYNGAGNQTVNNTPAYNHLRISGTGTKTLQGNTLIAGNLNLTAATLAGSTFNFSLGGNWTNAATFDAGTGTVSFNSNTGGTQSLTGNTTFFNLTLANSHTTDFGATTTTIGNTLNKTAGTMNGNASTIIFTGTPGANNGIIGGSAKTFFNLTINAGANIQTDTSATNNLTVNGVFLNNGIFTQSSNNITFNGAYTNAGTLTQSAPQTTTFGGGAQSLSGAGSTTFGTVNIQGSSTVNAGAHNFSVVGASFTATGIFTGSTGTVTFNGSGAQTILGSGSKNFSGLAINNANGVTVNDIVATAVDASVSGALTLTTDLTVGAGAIVQQSGTSAGTGDVIGTVRRSDIGATAKAFGNPFNTIAINSGTAPTQMDFNLVKAVPAGFPAAILRNYTLTPTGGGLFSATMSLHYLDGELNGNTEPELTMWKNISGTWTVQGRTSMNTISNFVTLAGISSFSEWTLADRPDTTVTSIIRNSPNPTNASSVAWTVVFANAVTGLTASNFTLNNTAGPCTAPSVGTVTPTGPTPATTWLVGAITGSGSCTLRLDLANDVGVSHDVTNEPFITGEAYTVDKTPPSTTSFTRFSPAGNPTNADSLQFQVVFSEPVTGVDTTDFTVNGGSTATPFSVSGTSPGTTFIVTVQGGNLAGFSGTVGLDFNSGAPANFISDGAGNNLPKTDPATDQTYTLDNMAPTVDVVDVTPDPRNTDVSSITIVFSEAVTGFDLADLSLTLDAGTNLLTGAQTLTSGDNITWTLGNLSGITGTDGTYVLTVAAAGSGIMDTAGNALAANASDTWVTDATNPDVTINQAAGQTDPAFGNPIDFTAIFTEPVTGFDNPTDVTVTGTAAGAATATVVITPVSTTEYTVSVSGITGDGTVIVNIPPSKAVDLVGNPNDAGTFTDNQVTFVTCTPPPGNPGEMVAWYTGDNTPRDVAGGNDGTLQGGATDSASGKVGAAFLLNGTTAYVSAFDSTTLRPATAVTLDGWFNFASDAGTQVLISKSVGTGASDSYALFYGSGTLSGTAGNASGVGAVISTPFTPVVGTWYHLAYTFDSATDTQTIYVNGVGTSGTNTATLGYDSHPVLIGAESESEVISFFFNGRADEIEIFNVALTQPQIQSIMSADSGGKCKPFDLDIDKASDGSFDQGSAGNTFTITVENDGPTATAGQLITVTDTLPTGLTPMAVSGSSDWVCLISSQTVTCDSTAIVASGGTFDPITITVTVANNTVSSLINTASVSAASGEMDTSDNSDTDTVTLVPISDVQVTKLADATVTAGNNLVYSINVANDGPSDAAGVTLTDTLPTGTTFVSLTPDADYTCTMPAVGAAGTVSCARTSPLAPGFDSFTLTVYVNPSVVAGTVLSNTATIDSTTTDNVSGNDSSTVMTTVAASANLSVTKTDSPDPVNAGSNLTYTITVTNPGPSNAASVSLSDTLPSGTTFVSNTVASGWACNTLTVGAGGTLTCTIASMPVGSAVFTLVAKVDSSVAAGTSVANNATATSSTDTDNTNNTGTANTTVAADANLAITKTDSPDPVTAGENITYTVNLTNLGASDAQGVTVTDAVPTGTTFVSAVVTTGTGWSVNTAGPVIFSKTTVAASEAAVFSIVVKVNANAANGATITNSATAASTTPDATNGNNTATTTTTVQTRADLAVTKTDSPDPVTAGENITYAIGLTNNGPSDAQTVALTDAVPANTTFVSATQNTGPAFSCSNPAAGASSGSVSCTAATLATGATATFTVVVKVNANAANGSTISNTATATTATTDPTPGVTSATATTTVQTLADLSVSNADSPDPVIAGNNLTYTIILTNTGPSDAQTVAVSNPLPANTTFVSASVTIGTGWSTTSPTVGTLGTVTFAKATVAALETATFQIVVKVNANTPAGTVLADTATATTTTTDPTPGATTATTTTTVNTQADLAITKTDSPDPVDAGDNLTYKITVTNNGPSDAQTVNLTDPLPANSTFVSFTAPAGWTVTAPAAGANGTVTAARPSLAAGVVATFTLVVNVNLNTAHLFNMSNTATVTTATTDPTPGTTSATATTVVFADTPPTAAATAPNVSTSRGTSQTITVTYSDDFGINVSTLDNNDIRVTGPNGFDTAATFVGVNNPTNGTPRVATYTITTPGGEWDISDNGTYNIVIQAGQVADTIGQTVAPGTIGTFTVNIPPVSIGGRITQFVTGGAGDPPLVGATVTVTGTGITTTTTATTDGNGNYVFNGLSHGGNFVLTPTLAGKVFDPITRSYSNVTANITDANFTSFDAGNVARTLTAGNVYPTPGTAAAVPILLNSLGNERSVSFTIQYSTTPLGTPTAACGQNAAGCTITFVNTPGQVVITVTPAGNAVFGQGLREIAVVTFPTFATNLSNTPIDITAASATNGTGDPLFVTPVDGLVVFAQGKEGDVATRTTGDGKLLANDPVIARQFVTREIMPDLTTNEFQRMDAAPTFTKGNEIIDASDLVVIQNYVARNIPAQSAGGAGEAAGTTPPLASAPAEMDAVRELGPEVTRSIGIASRNADRGRELTLDVDLNAQGAEIAASFTISYDQTKLSNPRLVLGDEMPAGAHLSVNRNVPGKLGILIDASDVISTTSQAKSMMRITFDVAQDASGGETRIVFDDTLASRAVSDREGNALPTRYNDAVITINGPAAANVEISGRVLTPDGRGLRNTTVTITDAQGVTRTATTQAFGHYSFDSIPANRSYTIGVASKRYSFTARRVEPSTNLTDIDLIGQQ